MHKKAKFYCFDCDGVLWRGKEVIPEARQFLIHLNQQVNQHTYYGILTDLN